MITVCDMDVSRRINLQFIYIYICRKRERERERLGWNILGKIAQNRSLSRDNVMKHDERMGFRW